ncbi:MAG TPA: SEC-C metal-binding domain-containing protein [Fimbriimonadaceae bacterium]|nr:SEC-C metal-binding domain-containing protein [Fimbriimonadaceae bacterium]HRJ32568.1 SEC-C metal-binding domain-containing protein [Fimbriimonadaceae bacterium]
MIKFLRKMFDSSDKDVKSLLPLVERINALETEISAMTDEQLQGTTAKFKALLAEGKKLDEILPEAFAVVREVSQRLLHMRQFDVQLLGGMVLHQGRIAEMKTGEGKTLVAVAPLYTNALEGKGAHLVTANDYLARRDAVWMGPIYHFLGLSVGIIQGQAQDSDELGGSYRYEPGADVVGDPRYMNLVPCSRREAYLCDITYGTNHEYGFDYLRDNMAFQIENLSMRELHFAIVDEVDSILIDEARTPHIISGPSHDDVSVYRVIDKFVKTLKGGEKDDMDTPGIHYVSDKKNHSASLTEEGMDMLEEMFQEAGLLETGMNLTHDPKLFHYVNASVKAYGIFQKDIDYVVRNNEVVIVDENTGRLMFGRRYSDGLHQALEAKEGVPVQRESQTVATITFQNLFRLYHKLAGMTGTAKTEEDEFRKIYGLDVVSIPTHRPMIRVDNDDVVYKTLEGKFRGIAREILRLYTKQQPVLVGTRSIEMSEMTSERLTAEMLQKWLMAERLFDATQTRKDIGKDVKNEITEAYNMNLAEVPLKALSLLANKAGLAGDALNSDHAEWFLEKHGLPSENKEHFEEALRHGIPHNVLNAKLHEKEALIIAEAGRKGAVTIATNMAGRGVDILLGGRVADANTEAARATGDVVEHKEHEEYASTYLSFRRGGKERAAPPLPLDDQERRGLAEEVRALGGLFILGTERHESRRIDNQLRGRAGRQGDPGESRFFVSLEDVLWKIFNAKMLENPMLKAWPPMEEVKAGFLSNMILKTQERIEGHFFEARKHVLEYDDVLNSQREHIYAERREFLLGKDARPQLRQGLEEVIIDKVNAYNKVDENGRPAYDYEGLYEDLNTIFPLVDQCTLGELQAIEPGQELANFLCDMGDRAYDAKIANVGEETMPQLERHVMLQAINDKWMDHLQMLDYIREGIGYRGYGQVDPLVAYRRETYDLFQTTLKQLRDQSVKYLFMAQVSAPVANDLAMLELSEEEAAALAEIQSGQPGGGIGWSPQAPKSTEPGVWPDHVDPKRVGRNDACPCGSGKKFKHCHYPQFRSEMLI